jgi:periplasmic copper chaperone A
MRRHTYIYALFLLAAPLLTLAKDTSNGIRVTDAWVRASHPGQQVGAAYMNIFSEKNAALVKVDTPAAKRAEIHSMEMKESVMVMREVESVALPENAHISFAPGGYHIMLMDLKQALKAGEKVPLKLNFKLGNETIEMDVMANVRKN